MNFIRRQVTAGLSVAILFGAALYLWSNNQVPVGIKLTAQLGFVDGKLTSCPNRENCRNSDDPQEKFQIAAITDANGEKWQSLVAMVSSLPRTKLISQSEDYLHFTQSSKLMRFVDDIEFHNRPEVGEIAVRSASRLGYRDFGVNIQRIELVRAILEKKVSNSES